MTSFSGCVGGVYPGVERRAPAYEGRSGDKGRGAGGVQAAERRTGDEAGYRAGDGREIQT